jgi:hypothetical protein
MSRIVKSTVTRTLALCLPALWTLAFAQAALGQDQAPAAETSGQAAPCIPAAGAQASAAESGPLEKPATGDGEVSAPCEDSSPGKPSGGETAPAESPDRSDPGAEPSEEETADAEGSADEVFKPGDEISEDYPVPLPSDI